MVVAFKFTFRTACRHICTFKEHLHKLRVTFIVHKNSLVDEGGKTLYPKTDVNNLQLMVVAVGDCDCLGSTFRESFVCSSKNRYDCSSPRRV